MSLRAKRQSWLLFDISFNHTERPYATAIEGEASFETNCAGIAVCMKLEVDL